MVNLYKSLLLISTLTGISNFGLGQSNEIKIRFIANCGLHITDGNSNLYFDFPYKSGFFMYSKYDKSEIVNIKDNPILIFTHKHPDHYSIRQVKKLKRQKKLKGKIFGPWNIEKLEQLSHSIQDFSIQSFKTKHLKSFNHYSYLITWHDKKIFISGDTENAELVASIKSMDWAFVPAWILMDINKKKLRINAKMIGLYHIGPGDHITTESQKIHLMDKQGEVISIPY